MTRRFWFQHYWWIAILAIVLGGVIALCARVGDGLSLFVSWLAAVLAFCYFVHQQKLAETMLFKQLFTEFNQRYDELNDKLLEISLQERAPTLDDKKVIIDYFNLCGEEYLFFREGYIHPHAWRAWCRGMLWYFEKQPFQGIWKEERTTDSYYGLAIEAIRTGAT